MYQNVAYTDSAGKVYIKFIQQNFYCPKMTSNDVFHFPFSENVFCTAK